MTRYCSAEKNQLSRRADVRQFEIRVSFHRPLNVFDNVFQHWDSFWNDFMEIAIIDAH